MKKRAQGLPITTIVIAALAMIVLFILVWMVTTKFGEFGKGVREETKIIPCVSPNTITSYYDCDEPLIGIYGTADGKTRLGRGQVCCPSAGAQATTPAAQQAPTGN